jgi:hypothetical protein
MPLRVIDVNTMKEYINGVMGRADHHAAGVSEIALALAGAIMWRKDNDPIQVKAYKGQGKNVLWVKINGDRYAFSYNHNTGTIEMHQRSMQGSVLHTFSNVTPLSQIKQIFESL